MTLFEIIDHYGYIEVSYRVKVTSTVVYLWRKPVNPPAARQAIKLVKAFKGELDYNGIYSCYEKEILKSQK